MTKEPYPYDYEAAFKHQLNKMESLFVEEMLRNQLKLHYAAKTIKAGTLVEVEIYPLFHNKEDVPQIKKDNRRAQRNLNERKARKKFVRLINANFTQDDLWLTLTYENGYIPMSIADAEKKIKNYIARINYLRRKNGIPNATYIYLTEWSEGENGIRTHHHLFMDHRIDRNILEDMWQYAERNESQRLVPDENGLSGLGNYLAKDPKGKKRWKGSKNLKKPQETVNHTKVKKTDAQRMAKDYEEVRTFFEKDKQWGKYQFINAEVRYNEFNAAFYIYITARKKNEKSKTKKNNHTGASAPIRVPAATDTG